MDSTEGEEIASDLQARRQNPKSSHPRPSTSLPAVEGSRMDCRLWLLAEGTAMSEFLYFMNIERWIAS
jgi:hypothetical protein